MKWKLRGNAGIALRCYLHPHITATNHPNEWSPAPCLEQTDCPEHLKSSHTMGYKLRQNHCGVNKTERKGNKKTHFILPNKKTLNTGTKKKNHPLIQLSFLEEGTWGAAISMRPVSSPWWSRAPRSSQQPSVQELQGALSLGNRIIIKQVTSGTCFSPRTSGKDNCVSVNDGWVFAGLAAGPCARCDWLAGAGRSLSAHFSWP